MNATPEKELWFLRTKESIWQAMEDLRAARRHYNAEFDKRTRHAKQLFQMISVRKNDGQMEMFEVENLLSEKDRKFLVAPLHGIGQCTPII